MQRTAWLIAFALLIPAGMYVFRWQSITRAVANTTADDAQPGIHVVLTPSESSRPKPTASLGADFAIWPEKIQFGGEEWQRAGDNITPAEEPGIYTQTYFCWRGKGGEKAVLQWTFRNDPESEAVLAPGYRFDDVPIFRLYTWNGANQWPTVHNRQPLPKRVGTSDSWPE